MDDSSHGHILVASRSTTQHSSTLPSRVVQPTPRSTNCPLLKLPPELRLQIYEKLFKIYKGKLCLTSVDGVWYRIDSTLIRNRKTCVPGQCVALLATCKKIYTEARPVLFANIPFVLHIRGAIFRIALEHSPVALMDMVTNVQAIHLHIDLPESTRLTAEGIRTILAPAVEATNIASSARELRISLNIHGLRDQAYLDRIMLCVGEIRSSASLTMILDTSGEPTYKTSSKLNYESFTVLLKRILRVDETRKVWLAQLAWEKQKHADHIQALAMIEAKRQRKRNARDQLLLLHFDAGFSFPNLWSKSSDSGEIDELDSKVESLSCDKREQKKYIKESERTIADLERKLESMQRSHDSDG